MKFLSVCEVCFRSYYLDGDEIYTPPNMKLRTRKRRSPYLGTWGDWVQHIQSHCPACREEMPQSAADDLKVYELALEAENKEITKDDVIPLESDDI